MQQTPREQLRVQNTLTKILSLYFQLILLWADASNMGSMVEDPYILIQGFVPETV